MTGGHEEGVSRPDRVPTMWQTRECSRRTFQTHRWEPRQVLISDLIGFTVTPTADPMTFAYGTFPTDRRTFGRKARQSFVPLCNTLATRQSGTT